jgi:hypothetical protein
MLSEQSLRVAPSALAHLPSSPPPPGAKLSPLGTAATAWPIVQAPDYKR